jgi:hypothetical protein
METIGVSKVVGPFLLMVDPAMCNRKEDFDMQKKNEYKYLILGGNHSAYARMDLIVASPDYSTYKKIQSLIFVGLNNVQARTLAWTHNIDNEFKSNMTLIQKIMYVHLRFVENNCIANVQLKTECAQEIQIEGLGKEG